MSDGIRGSLSNNNMKKTKPIASATAFIRKRKEKWRPSLTGSEDIHEGSTRSESNEYVSVFFYFASLVIFNES